MHITRVHLVLGCLAALLASACGASATEEDIQELRIADAAFIVGLDSDDGESGYALTAYGIAETLTRVDRDMSLAPWIAESYEWLDPLTLEVTIRDDVTFWDGTKVDAEAVAASFERSLERNPATAQFLPEGTSIEANGNDLTIRTTTPVAALPNNLAHYSLAIKTETASGDPIYTGAYRFEDYVASESVRLVAYEEHREPPGVASLFVRHVPDENTRRLALQSGDVDMVTDVLPASARSLESEGFEVASSNTANQIMMLLNTTRPPFDDPAVREALSSAIDRSALVESVLDGSGAPSEGIVPSELGIDGVQDLYTFDLDAATSTLDSAGWRLGAGGVREKGGRRLEFTLYYYTRRAELEPIATILQGELEKAGFEVAIENVADITTTVAEHDFAATLYSATTATTGDLGRFISNYYTPGPERYENSDLAQLVGEYTSTQDAEERRRLFEEIQAVAADDVPVIPLVTPNKLVVMTETAARMFTPHPLENYRFTPGVSIHEPAASGS